MAISDEKRREVGEEGNEYGECFYAPFMPCFCPSCGAEVVDE